MLGGLTVMAGGWSAALPGGGRSSTLRLTMTATTDRTVDLCEDVMSISFPPTADQFRVTGCFPVLSVTAAHRYGAAAAFGRDNRFPPTCAQSSCLSHMAAGWVPARKARADKTGNW